MVETSDLFNRTTKCNFCVTKIKYSMYNIQDYSDISHIAVCPVVCKGWHFIQVENTCMSTSIHREGRFGHI